LQTALRKWPEAISIWFLRQSCRGGFENEDQQHRAVRARRPRRLHGFLQLRLRLKVQGGDREKGARGLDRPELQDHPS